MDAHLRRSSHLLALVLMVSLAPAPGAASATEVLDQPRLSLLTDPAALCGDEPGERLLMVEAGDDLEVEWRLTARSSALFTVLVDGVAPAREYRLIYGNAGTTDAVEVARENAVAGAVTDGQVPDGGTVLFGHLPMTGPEGAPALPLPLMGLAPLYEAVREESRRHHWAIVDADTGEEVATLNIDARHSSLFGTGTTEDECEPATDSPWLTGLLPGGAAPNAGGPSGAASAHGADPLAGSTTSTSYERPCEPGEWPSLRMARDRAQTERRKAYENHELLTYATIPYDLVIERVTRTCDREVERIDGALHMGLSWARTTDLDAGSDWWAMGVHGQGWKDPSGRPRSVRLYEPAVYAHGEEIMFLETYRPGITQGYGSCGWMKDVEQAGILIKWLVDHITKRPWWWPVSDRHAEDAWDRSLERHCTQQYVQPSWDPWLREGCEELAFDEGPSCIRWLLRHTTPNHYSWSLKVGGGGGGSDAVVVYAYDGGASYLDCWSEEPLRCWDTSRHFTLPAIRVDVPLEVR